MATTFDLIVEVGALVADIMEAGGEVSPEQEDRLAALLGDGEIAHKLEALHAVVRRLKGEADILKGEEKRIVSRRRAAEKQAARLADMAGELLRVHEDLTGAHKVKTTVGSAWWQDSQTIEVTDADAVPLSFIERRPHILKADIKAALEAGDEVPGCSLQTTRSIRWR